MIIQLQDLSDVRKRHKDERIILTSGTFDLLHVGHLRYLEAIKALGDVVIVLLSGDNRVKARKGPKRPIIPQNDRAQMLDALKVVDYVFVDPATSTPDEINPVHAEIVAELQPDMYATDGKDLRFWNIMEESKLAIVPRANVDGLASTTEIIDRIIVTHSQS